MSELKRSRSKTGMNDIFGFVETSPSKNYKMNLQEIASTSLFEEERVDEDERRSSLLKAGVCNKKLLYPRKTGRSLLVDDMRQSNDYNVSDTPPRNKMARKDSFLGSRDGFYYSDDDSEDRRVFTPSKLFDMGSPTKSPRSPKASVLTPVPKSHITLGPFNNDILTPIPKPTRPNSSPLEYTPRISPNPFSPYVLKSPNPFSPTPTYAINMESLSLKSSYTPIKRRKKYGIADKLYMPSPKKSTYPRLAIDTGKSNTLYDSDSPTDVLSFPTFEKSPLPPTTPFKTNKATFFDDDLSMPFKPHHNRFESDFDILGTIGKGSFGTVYQCMSKLDGVMYAIKETKRQAKSMMDKQRMLKEVYALAALSDQGDVATFHIVRYHQAWMSDDARLYIQTELCTCTLVQEIQTKNIDESRKYKLLREMLLALDLLHRNHMVHLDIKPENIFIKNNQYKLGDFGLASKDNVSNIDEEGDSRYMSKELLSGDYHDLTKCDIFSLGATIYEVCINTHNSNQYTTLPANGQQWHDIRNGQLHHDIMSFELRSILMEMIHSHPHKRPTANHLLENKVQLLSEDRKLILLERNKAAGLQLKMNQLLDGVPRPTLTRSRSCF